ncbi:hypothetical protein V5O48_017961 [Marasmius crinis-equi]|uniref:CFEM domain-containing protein n=1 Tax=Marasmius crinis-equi TaxID=585013 RepID=A0ABR3EMJ1_9AGAR
MVSAHNLLVPFILAASALADSQSTGDSTENDYTEFQNDYTGFQNDYTGYQNDYTDFQSTGASYEFNYTDLYKNLLAISTPERGLQSRRGLSTEFASNIPECNAPCTSAATTVNNCKEDTKCVCTDSFSDGVASCFNCAAAHQPNTTSEAQNLMNDFVNECKAKGLTIKSQTIHSNGDSNGALSAVTRTGTGVAASLVVIGLGFLL